MRRVWFIPGFSASELWQDLREARLFWVDYSRIALLTPGAMRLDRRGVRPGGPDGKPMFAGNVITTGWGTLRTLLQIQLAQDSILVNEYGWDWRKDILEGVHELAARVIVNSTPDEPAILVGHSAGGLVARSVWTHLRNIGFANRVSRVITLGTPHYGTYYALSQWAGVGDWVQQLNFLGQVTGGMGGSLAVALAGRMSVGQLVDVCLTFPSLYQLMPVIGAPDEADDPHRHLLYEGGVWKGLPARISTDHLTIIAPEFHRWQLSERTRVPDEIMTVVSGNGVPTPHGLVRPDRLGFSQALGTTSEGDGVVTVASAEGGYGVVYTVRAGHSDLPRVVIESGLLRTLILDARTPTTPLPPRVEDNTVKIMTDGIPPLGVTEAAIGGKAPCVGGSCNC